MDLRTLPGYEVSNLAAWGWEWTSGDTTYQLVGLRGVQGAPMFSAKRTNGQWHHSKCADVWACDGTRKGFLTVVERFLSKALSVQASDE